MSEVALRVQNLSKQYTLGGARQRHNTLRDQITHGVKRAFGARPTQPSAGAGRPTMQSVPHSFWALKDVSLRVAHGEVLGIIGRNGAG